MEKKELTAIGLNYNLENNGITLSFRYNKKHLMTIYNKRKYRTCYSAVIAIVYLVSTTQIQHTPKMRLLWAHRRKL